jgi:hypothetical protein
MQNRCRELRERDLLYRVESASRCADAHSDGPTFQQCGKKKKPRHVPGS